MSLDVRDIAAKKASEDDGGVAMGSSTSRIYLGDSGFSVKSQDASGEGSEGTISLSKDQVFLEATKIVLSADLDSIFLGGGFSFNPELMTGLPSTIVSPIPVLKITPFSAFKSIVDKARNIGSMFG